MAKRRTRKEKVGAQKRTVRPVLKTVRKAATEKELYFRRDLVKSLVVISAILALELGWWLYSR